MPTLLLEQAPALFDEGLEHDPRRGLGGAVDTGPTDAHGRLTLDELLSSAWEGLAVRGAVTCPVCAEPMAVRMRRAPVVAPRGRSAPVMASRSYPVRTVGGDRDGGGLREVLVGQCLGCGAELC